VVATCRRLKIPVRDYLGSVLPGLGDFSISRIAEVTPAAWSSISRCVFVSGSVKQVLLKSQEFKENVDITIPELAARQLRDYLRHTPGTYFAEEHPPLQLEEAYGVQAEVAKLRSLAGESIAGFKIGCIGPKIREQFRLSGPIRGFVFKSELHASGSKVSSSMHSSLAVEGEMAVRMGEEGQVAYAFPVIELHNYVLRARIKLLSELVANNALNAGVILPKGEHIMAHPARARTGTLEVRINNRLADAGTLWSMPGGLEEAVAWLTNHLRDYRDLTTRRRHHPDRNGLRPASR
jgi:2-keto-4-pentenoate hydratase